jgi:formylglycine-generating enzyme required for sulfatase activity
VDRVETGNMLARVGDPRFNPDLWHLPVEAESPLGLVEIPAGTFWMGEGDEKHEIHLSRFFIGRYPTTVGQLRAFADASGYETAYSIGPSDIVNHPATRVAWHDDRILQVANGCARFLRRHT